jgi:hypothetical protein
MTTRARPAVIKPPVRKEIRAGQRLAISNAGDTKLATTLMPMVATVKVTAARIRTALLCTCATSSTGSVMALP